MTGRTCIQGGCLQPWVRESHCGTTGTGSISMVRMYIHLSVTGVHVADGLAGIDTVDAGVQGFITDFIKASVEAHTPAPQCHYVQVQDNESP